MKLVYLAGAYRSSTIHGTVENIRRAEAVAIELWKRGYAVICPHMNSALLDGVVDDSVFLAGGIEMLKRCDILVMMDGWEDSKGSNAELEEALRIPGLLIEYAKDLLTNETEEE